MRRRDYPARHRFELRTAGKYPPRAVASSGRGSVYKKGPQVLTMPNETSIQALAQLRAAVSGKVPPRLLGRS